MLEEHISIAGYTGNMKPKAPPVYAFRGQKAHGNQGFSAVVGGVAE